MYVRSPQHERLRMSSDRKAGEAVKRTFSIVIWCTAALLFAVCTATAQTFVEQPSEWKTVTIKASGIDTTKIVLHSTFALDPINDTLPLIYYEPYPDSMMPKTAIEVASITIQRDNADDVVEILEEQARRLGADWIVGFNEPRGKWEKIDGSPEHVYRSTALLYRVIDQELVPKAQVAIVDCSSRNLKQCKAVLTWIDEEHKTK